MVFFSFSFSIAESSCYLLFCGAVLCLEAIFCFSVSLLSFYIANILFIAFWPLLLHILLSNFVIRRRWWVDSLESWGQQEVKGISELLIFSFQEHNPHCPEPQAALEMDGCMNGLNQWIYSLIHPLINSFIHWSPSLESVSHGSQTVAWVILVVLEVPPGDAPDNSRNFSRESKLMKYMENVLQWHILLKYNEVCFHFTEFDLLFAFSQQWDLCPVCTLCTIDGGLIFSLNL